MMHHQTKIHCKIYKLATLTWHATILQRRMPWHSSDGVAGEAWQPSAKVDGCQRVQ